MHNNDEVRITVGQTCGDEVVHIIRRLHDATLVKSAMRAIETFRLRQNIRYLVSEHATEVVVKSMNEHPEDTELLQLDRRLAILHLWILSMMTMTMKKPKKFMLRYMTRSFAKVDP